MDFFLFRGVPFVPFASRYVEGVGTFLDVFESILKELVSGACRDFLFSPRPLIFNCVKGLGAEVGEGQSKLLV